MLDLLQTHPNTHKKWQTTYFIPSTIKLQPQYQHLAKKFKPFFQITHNNTNKQHSYSQTYTIKLHTNHPPLRIVYALFAITSPIETCKTHLQYQPTLDWTLQLLEKWRKLPNLHECHIETPHLYTLFLNTHLDKISSSNTTSHRLRIKEWLIEAT